MLRRWCMSFGAMTLLVLGLGLSLVPLLLVRTQVDPSLLLTLGCLWLALVPLILLVVANRLVQRIWFFRGQGQPISLEQLRQRLLTINAIDCPVAALRKGKKLVITWRYGELQWCELFSRLGKPRLEELHCHFDTDTRTVYLLDRYRQADFLICPDRVKTGRQRLPLPLLRARSKRLAAIESYASLAGHEYTFTLRELKSPVLGTILASGWHVRFSLF